MQVLLQSINCLETSTNRIQMNVIHNTQHRSTVFNEQGLVSTLKHMIAFMNESIKTIGKGTLEPLHAYDQIGVLCFEADVIVIGQEHIRYNRQPNREHVSNKTRSKAPADPVTVKNAWR